MYAIYQSSIHQLAYEFAPFLINKMLRIKHIFASILHTKVQ